MPRNLPYSTRQHALYDKEAEVREIADLFSQAALKTQPWHTETVTRFVERSVMDFQTLLKWLEELESAENWDGEAISDVSYGLAKLHQNLVTNLREVEDNHKYQKYHADCINFIGQHLNKPNQYLIKVANSQILKMEEAYEKVVEELAQNVSIGQRLDQKQNVWEEYREVRRQLKQMKDRLWEVEAHEERLVELDDWREELGHWTSKNMQELCGKIDKQNGKIMKYTRLDLDLRWNVVDRDLKKLQLLRVQTLLTWISEQPVGSRPHWLCEELKDHLVDACREYSSMEDRACEGTGWVGVERNSDYDLVLEMAYSKIRAALARVKYGRIENKRHRSELEIYRDWVEQNKDSLRDSTKGQLDRLLERAEDKVGEVEMRLTEYVGLPSTGGERARDAARALETTRIGKRNVMKEAIQTIVHSWKGDGRSLPFVSYSSEKSVS
eukprot:GFUD01068246.1.p1 GENE.GFUD01068246.1~~GFUD01068246.1.p1  ORF type:complete len:471 (-),score=157.58 GFUD01068246.1:5-1324(-)